MILFHYKRNVTPILLVDDDVDLLATFEESLSLRGYDIVTANNGKDAIL